MDRRRGVRNKRGRCEIRYARAKGQPPVSEVLPIPYTATGVIEAAKIRQARIDYYRHGIGEIEGQGDVPTFAQLAQTWLDTHEQTASSRRAAKSKLNRHWMPDLGALRVDHIRYAKLREIMATKRHLRPKTQINIIGVLRSVLHLAVQSDYITSNPAAQFGRIKHQKPAIDPFTREERDRIMEALEGDEKLFYAIRFYCGLRPGEVLALTWADYDGSEINVDKQIVEHNHLAHTKTQTRRQVKVHPYVRSLLREHPTRFQGGHILVNGAGPYTRSDHFARALTGDKGSRKGRKRATVGVLDQLGIRRRSPYNARHTCASMMLEAGADPAYCAKQLGHSLEMFFRAYSTLINQDREQSEAEKVERYL